MLLTKRLKAGILLYALFMAAVFALLLQFYISRVQTTTQLQTLQHQQAQASLMAELTKELADKPSGAYQFDQGSASYTFHQQHLIVRVQLNQGTTYSYRFFKPEAPEKKNNKESDVKHGETTTAPEEQPSSLDKEEVMTKTEVDASTSV